MSTISPQEISILAVVTQPQLQQELAAALTGFHLSLCASVKEALADIFEADHVPDIILLQLPDGDARNFSALIHEDKHLALIPILLIYDQAHLPEPDRVLGLGAADLVPYPLNHDQLIALIHKHELTRRGWWETFHIEAPEKPQRIMNALKLARSKSPAGLAGKVGKDGPRSPQPGDSFQQFKQLLYRKSGLTRDRVKYLQPYTSEQLYQLGSALYLDSIQIGDALGEYLHLPVLDSFLGLEVSLGAVPAAFCRKNRVLPLKDRQGHALVAISNPFQLEVVDILNKLFKSYQLVVAPPELIEDVLNPDFRNTESWRQWHAIKQLRSSQHTPSNAALPVQTSAAQILPHKLPPKPRPTVIHHETPQPTNEEEEAAAQVELDFFYRGSKQPGGNGGQTEPPSGSDPELPPEEKIEPLAPSLVADPDLLDIEDTQAETISNERQAQMMEQRLTRAYQAYRDKKLQQENRETTDALAKLMESESDPEVAPIIHLVNSLIEKAHHLRASDIHIEPRETEVVIRYRIDGVLKIMHRLQPRAIIKPIVARVKIMAQMDISERRLPQDGHIRFVEYSPAHDIGLRVATVPMAYGEKVVMRLLDSRNSLLDLEDMGFSPAALSLYRHKIRSPYGMVLHVGPTGSGKTSTLYAALNEINDPEINIQTIENPIEYMLDGINQLEIKSDIGLNFARVLRSYLRQDPDVILVGEIRDEETAHIAVEAALTGHLLFSTLHTNDAAATIVRLLEMGIKPYLITSSLQLICAQRLLRKLCQHCRRPYQADQGVRHLLQLQPTGPLTLYEPNGCDECDQSGYRGRIGVYEILVPNEEIRQLMNTPGIASHQIKHAAMRNGMRTLFQEGIDKVMQGMTSLEEMTLKLMPDETQTEVLSSRPLLPV
ncbi:MAG: ATPase, T2SS/T4P/T4SS family [Candidatus Sericytochromatia bacterium]